MKVKNIYILLFSVLFTCFTQPIEREIPSLAELAKRTTAISTIYSPEYEKLSLQSKQQILERNGTLEQVLNFVKNNHDSNTQDLIASIPTKLWVNLLAKESTLEEFMEKIKDFTPAEERWLKAALTEKILEYLSQDSVKYFIFSTYVQKEPLNLSIENRLPIDFKLIGRIMVGAPKSLQIIKEKIIYDIPNLLIRFIGQKIQNLFLKTLVFEPMETDYVDENYTYTENIGFDNWTKNHVIAIVNELISFSRTKNISYSYVSKLHQTFENLFNQGIHSAMIYNLEVK